MVIICESIKKSPINTQAEVQTRVRLVRSGKIVMPETKPIFCSYGIQVLRPDKGPEITNTEVNVCCDIRTVADANTVLEIEFPDRRRITVGIVRCMILYFKACCNI